MKRYCLCSLLSIIFILLTWNFLENFNCFCPTWWVVAAIPAFTGIEMQSTGRWALETSTNFRDSEEKSVDKANIWMPPTLSNVKLKLVTFASITQMRTHLAIISHLSCMKMSFVSSPISGRQVVFEIMSGRVLAKVIDGNFDQKWVFSK